MATRRSNGEGTIWYAKSEGRFRAQYPDASGRRRTITGKTRKDIEKKLRIALTKRDSNTLEEMSSIAGTVEELLTTFLQSIEGKREPKTVERYSLDANRYLIPTLGKMKLNQMTSDVIELSYSTIQRNFNLSDNSMAHCHATLRGAIKRGIKHKKLATNPLLGVDAPSRKRVQIQPLTETQMLSALDYSAKNEGIMWSSMWRIHLLTGFRQGEVLGLTWEDVDFNEGTLRLHRQLQRQKDKGLVLKTLKADANKRTIKLDLPTLALLRTWKSEQSQFRLQLGKWGETNFIFTNSVGNPLEPRKAAKKWAELLKAVGIPHIKLHGARHTFATVMLQKNVDTKVVSHYLGHTDISTTQNIYQHVNSEMLANTANLIGEMAQ
jgi:integrase